MTAPIKKPVRGRDLIFPPAERQDRLSAQLNKKINLPDKRLIMFKRWGRS